MKTILVTGSKGFVGLPLVKMLREISYHVIELDIFTGSDITDWKTIEHYKDFDVLIHLAARTFVPYSFNNPRDFYQTNVLGTLNMLELCRINKAKMIFTSSYVYGKPEYLPIDEKHPLKAFNPYAQSKIMGEELCQAYYRDFGINSIILRPFNIYGPAQPNSFLIPSIIKQVTKKSVIKLKDPRPKRDYVFIDDVIAAYVKAIGYNQTGVSVFNIGTALSTSVEQLVKYVCEIMGNDVDVVFSNEQRKNEVLETKANITKAKNLLQWESQFSIEKGIFEILNH